MSQERPTSTNLEDENRNGPLALATKENGASRGGRISRGEICRKTLHMTPGLLPFLLAMSPHPDPLGPLDLRNVAVLCFLMTGLFLALHRVVRRPGEDNLLSTALSYPGTILVTLLLFPGNSEFACVVVVVLAFGDGSAYLGGTLFGKTRLPWNRDKTWFGSMTFIGIAAPIASLAYLLEAKPEVTLIEALLCGTAAALAGAAAESIPTKITDNLRVGIASSVAVIVTHIALFGTSAL